ncbi:MAG: hypothetical protein ACRCZ9_09435 [Fusobacteriaceae bacterium]
MSVKPFEVSVSWNKEFTLRKKNGNCFHTLNLGFINVLAKTLEKISEIKEMDASVNHDEYMILATAIGNEVIITIYDRIEEDSFSFACRIEQLMNESFKLTELLKSVS